MQLVIIGGSDAGISAALRAREIDPSMEVTLVVADAFPNYSICGLPFFLSGEVTDWRTLAHRSAEDITQQGIRLLINHTATAIDPERHIVTVLNQQQQCVDLPYDRVVIATGATPIRPVIDGVDLPGVFLLHSMADSFAVDTYIREKAPQSALIIGGGYIGLEMADALTLRGINVTLVEHHPTVLKTVDTAFGSMVADELQRHGVTVISGTRIEHISPQQDHLYVQGTGGFSHTADLVLAAVGVKPASSLAKQIGVETGKHDAIRVSRFMETNLPHVYAAGDCTETFHHVLQASTYLPLGTTAHKQGRIAGENSAGHPKAFHGSLGTQVLKVFDLAIARTGLREDEALAAGFAPFTHDAIHWDHKVYYPGAHKLRIRITGDRNTGRLLGAQMIGHWHSEIAKRIDIFATALFHQMSVEDLSELDLSYTPPLSSPWDPVQMSAQAWVKEVQTLEVKV
ncbi:putative pyridine nucleotide-disulphide oxidoreductase [Dictyobacter alpinus]|uniref:Putative pyridine nucleotide-disulphide oxidoreductase n=1 Tax=Dictyobacter alpinus TaxID=2014873 RepID=A0A402B183_9CHLR|nr:FAD-dependent oxidoreductase [Dictyobacter alpinus]GCE25111.1 putative pyridine nucleotide-disulphide oxidoreductase [Dictyobacter alpinus]